MIAKPLVGALLAVGVGVLAIAAQAQDRTSALKERLGSARAERAGNARDNGRAEGIRVQTLSYGTDPLQKLDYYPANRSGAPLVVFVHGGGWKRGDKDMMRGSDKLTDWHGKGYAVASVNYRLVPAATVEQQAADVAQALATLKRGASALGFDPSRIVLTGHSAGAHLVALVGTDPQWLRGADLGMDAVRGVIPLDGAAYDVPSQMGENAHLMGDTYEQAFGTDPVRQRALSPTFHAGGPNAPAFLLLHVQRADGKRQSEELAAALRKAGTPVELHAVAGRGLVGHMEINRKLGDPAYPATPIVDGWLARVFAR